MRTDAASSIRQAEAGDLAGIVEVHRLAFPNSFLTCLGDGFLRRYYRLVLNYEPGILLVSGGNPAVEGFAAGFLNPDGFYRAMRRIAWKFVAPVAGALIRNPSLIGRVANSVRRIGKTGATRMPAQACELSSIAVLPFRSGRGIGKALAQAFLERAWAKGAKSVYLTTDADRNEQANGFYWSLGFQLQARFERYRGRLMNEYVLRSDT